MVFGYDPKLPADIDSNDYPFVAITLKSILSGVLQSVRVPSVSEIETLLDCSTIAPKLQVEEINLHLFKVAIK